MKNGEEHCREGQMNLELRQIGIKSNCCRHLSSLFKEKSGATVSLKYLLLLATKIDYFKSLLVTSRFWLNT